MSEESIASGNPELEAIAKAAGCSVSEVARAFSSSEAPELFTHHRVLEYERLIEILDDLIKHGSKFAASLERLDPLTVMVGDEHQIQPTNMHLIMMETGANIDVSTLRETSLKLVDEARAHKSTFDSLFARLPKTGRNREPSTALLLDALGRLFENLERPITFGHNDGEPSTPFSRTADAAFRAYQLKTKWRRATETWVRKHNEGQKT
ncbi:MAG: hypothetical protein AAGJ74_06065 [Pseudomonadota bacterium]